MSEWSSNKAFREDYEKRILSSLDSRQLSRDGRMRNPDEKPIISEAPATRDVENLPAKVNAKQASSAKEAKEDKLVPPQQDVISNKKVQDTNIKKSPEVESRGKVGDPVGTGDSYTPEKSQKEPPKPTENDVAKLKEIKREEEIAKAKLALERKKKQAEKAAAKAVVRAQKEAEKKLKASISLPCFFFLLYTSFYLWHHLSDIFRIHIGKREESEEEGWGIGTG